MLSFYCIALNKPRENVQNQKEESSFALCSIFFGGKFGLFLLRLVTEKKWFCQTCLYKRTVGKLKIMTRKDIWDHRVG
jgi:hypothetical protein